MRSIIHKLRQKSLASRHAMVIALSLGLTFLIGAGWAMSLSSTSSAEKTAKENNFKPFAMIKDSFTSEWSNVFNKNKQSTANVLDTIKSGLPGDNLNPIILEAQNTVIIEADNNPTPNQ